MNNQCTPCPLDACIDSKNWSYGVNRSDDVVVTEQNWYARGRRIASRSKPLPGNSQKCHPSPQPIRTRETRSRYDKFVCLTIVIIPAKENVLGNVGLLFVCLLSFCLSVNNIFTQNVSNGSDPNKILCRCPGVVKRSMWLDFSMTQISVFYSAICLGNLSMFSEEWGEIPTKHVQIIKDI